jgi:hypothetical protein
MRGRPSGKAEAKRLRGRGDRTLRRGRARSIRALSLAERRHIFSDDDDDDAALRVKRATVAATMLS